MIPTFQEGGVVEHSSNEFCMFDGCDGCGGSGVGGSHVCRWIKKIVFANYGLISIN